LLAGVQQINLFVDPSLGGSGYIRLSFGGTPAYVVLKQRSACCTIQARFAGLTATRRAR
jgi:hypothetical protein